MKLTQILMATALTAMPAWGSITINFGASQLTTAAGGSLVPAGSLVIIGASTLDGTFGAPIPGKFFSGVDDIEIARGTVNPAGDFSLSSPGLTYSGNWNQNDPLQIYWYPTLGGTATAPVGGEPYGSFRTDTIQAGSNIAWISPPDLGTYALSFVTVNGGGVNADVLAQANFTVVPEPGAYMGVFGVMSLLGGMFIRRLRKS